MSMDRILDEGWKFLGHYRKLEEDLEELESEFRVLKRRKIDINSRIEAEVRHGQKVKKEVEGWLKDVKKIKKEVKDIKKRVHNGVPFYKRISLDKQVQEKIEVVKTLYEREIFSEDLVIERAPARGIIIATENIEGEISTQDEIRKHLMDDKVGMIGVCGIGGVGKTTIMKHINNDLLREGRFQKVIWVVVSYPLNVLELQKKIAHAMDERLREDEEMRRAAELMAIMGRKSFVLILDDVWEKFSLQDVGIPEPVQNKSKVVITTRSIGVCKCLGCKIVKVQPLSQEESLTLFLNKVGLDVLQISGLEEILKLIVNECAGLPLAIVVIAGSMIGVDDIKVWRNALTELQEGVKSVKDSDDEIFVPLRFSFDRLANEEIKNCFLYCSLFHEDYSFEREELIEGWIDEGLIDGLRSRKAAYDRGHAFLDMLEKNCLLEKHFRREIKMHDVVRDMAIRSIGPGVGYMVKAGRKLTVVPNEHEWAINLKKVSLMANKISKIPVGLTPKCPMLSTLILSSNPLTKIPESFFEGMSGLKVLDLSDTYIEALPGSISKLEHLCALQLGYCERLKCLPSLEKLVALKKLDLNWAGIEVVPQGVEMLECLEYLNLCCDHLKEIPTGILSKLSSLQYLVVAGDWGRTSVKINFKEAASLRKLEVLECNFDDIQHFNYFISKSKNFRSLTTYKLLVGTAMGWEIAEDDFGHECRLTINECDIGDECLLLPKNLQHLWIRKCKSIGSCLNKIVLPENATELNSCTICDCEDIEYLVELDSSPLLYCPILDKVGELTVEGLPNLSALVRVEGVATPPHVFSNLKKLYIWACSGMKRLLPLELLQALQNLEMINVLNCEQMEEIIASSDSDASSSDEFTFTFPKLRELCLWNLPQLRSICNAKEVMVCNSIEKIAISGCLELKRIGVQLPQLDNGQPSPPPHLREIKIGEESKEWWESVEWDHPNTKNLLQPFLKYSNRWWWD